MLKQFLRASFFVLSFSFESQGVKIKAMRAKKIKNQFLGFWSFFVLPFFILFSLFLCKTLLVRADLPLLATSTPAIGAYLVSSSSPIQISFNQNIYAGSGRIYIKRLSDNSIFADIPASSSLVLVSGSSVTIRSRDTFESGVQYYFQVSSDAFRNSSGEYYAGISDRSRFFSVEDYALSYNVLANLQTLTGDAVWHHDFIDGKAFGSGFLLWAYAGDAGQELWMSDGTDAGTEFLIDANAGPNNGCPGGGSNYYQLGSDMYLDAYDEVEGMSLIKTDGTAAGTSELKGILDGINFYPLGDNGEEIFFYGSTTGYGYELMAINGTLSSVRLIKDVNPGSANSSIFSSLACGGVFYFSATHASYGTELWRSDGTTSGTFMVKDVNSGSADANPSVKACLSGAVIFTANDGINGTELWRTDGTASGTTMIKNIAAGASSIFISGPGINYDQNYYFSLDDSVNDSELWRTDGTVAGTVLVSDIYPGLAASYPEQFVSLGSSIYFIARTPNYGYELMSYSSSTNSVSLVKDICAGSCNGLYFLNALLIGAGDKIYIAANYYGGDVWVSDGTTAGTRYLFDVNPESNYEATMVSAGNGKVLMYTEHPNYGNEFFTINSADDSYSLIRDFNTLGVGSSPNDFYESDGNLYFLASQSHHNRIWRMDGGENISMVLDSQDYSVQHLVGVMSNRLIYGVGSYLRAHDLSSLSTTSYSNLTVYNSMPGFINAFQEYKGRIYFNFYNAANGGEVWSTDGFGSRMLANICPGTCGSQFSSSLSFGVLNDRLFFGALASTAQGQELWRSNGTTSGTMLVKDIYSGANNGGNPSSFLTLGGNLIFNARDVNQYELHISNGTTSGTSLLKDINSGVSGSYPQTKIVFGGQAYFYADDGINGYELWTTNGMAAGTSLLKNINPVGDSGVGGFVEYGGKLYFDANDGNGFGLWTTSGTATSTRLIHRYAGGLSGEKKVFGGNLYASYYTASYGAEPTKIFWRSAPTLSSSSVSSVTDDSVFLTASIISEGGASSSLIGFMIGSSSTLTINDFSASSSQIGSFGEGEYSLSITSLSCETEYYYRAFVNNKAGYGYGQVATFTTATCTCPTVSQAVTYNFYPTCGPTSCSSGYHLSAGACVADSSGGGSSGGPGGGSGSTLLIPRRTIVATTTKSEATVNHLLSSSTIQLSDSESQEGTSALTGKWGTTGYNTAKQLYDLSDPDIDCHQDLMSPALAIKRREEAATMKQTIAKLVKEQTVRTEGLIKKFKRQVLESRLAGRILLQVESNGEAWYINPNNNKRYYLGRPIDMFNMMREFGLGVTHKYIIETTIFPRRLWGKILIDVEDRGRAYYINPLDKKKYYLACPTHAFRVVRLLGLGISNNDIDMMLAGEN